MEEMILSIDNCCDQNCDYETPALSQVKYCDSTQTQSLGDMEHSEFVKLAIILQDSVLHAWKLHLKTKKYYVHLILEEYYDEAFDIIDALIEHYQGLCKCNIISDCIECDMVKSDDPVTYFTDLKDYLVKFLNNPNNFNEKNNEIKSDIDDLLRLIDSTLYKLSNLTESHIKSFDAFIYENYK